MADKLDALSRVYAAAYSTAKTEEKSDDWARLTAKRACVDFLLVAEGGWTE